MRAGRYILAILMVTTGAVIARPDDLLPLASRIAAPFAAKSKVTATPEPVAPVPAAAHVQPSQNHALPDFVNTHHELNFPSTTLQEQPKPPAASDAQANAPSADKTDASAPAAVQAGIAAQIDAVTSTGKDPADTGPAASDASSSDVDPIQAALNSRDADGGLQRVAEAAVPDQNEGKASGAPKPLAAKMLFGKVKGPSLLQARSIGAYSRGCLAGGVALPVDGQAWQAMRLSRNRVWGHPRLIKLIETLAVAAREKDDWPGLLVGDISQPRGGPMLTGHASHQLGLDADIWLTPMPDHKLSRKERENMSATSMLDKTSLAVDPKVFTERQVRLIKRAASFPQVERVLVHPAIKKALCEAAGSDRGWLGKVRPYYGHYYHMHIRIGCPTGSPGCVPQRPTTGQDGCGKEVDDWLALLARPPKPPVPGAKKPAPKLPLMLAQLPADCKMVLESGADGIEIPPEALIEPPKKPAAQHKEAKAAAVVLKPAKERRPPVKHEAKAHGASTSAPAQDP